MTPRPRILSPPQSSLPAIREDSASDADDGLSLAGFHAEEDDEHDSRSSTSTIRPSTAPSPGTRSPSTASDTPTRAAGAASRRDSFDRRLNETDLHWRTRAVHSPVARQVITEVSGELRETHDALMRCLYAPEEMDAQRSGTKGKGVDDGYRWTPSVEQLRNVYTRTEDTEEGGKDGEHGKKSGTDRSGSETGGEAGSGLTLRGGGMQEFFGLKGRSGDPPSQPQRPQIISRPSQAFSRVVGRGSSGTATGPPNSRLEAHRTSPTGPQDPRLRRVQQSSMLQPPSFISNHGSSSLGSYGRTASIAPEGSVASYYMGFQTRPGTLYEPSESNEPQVSSSKFPHVPAPPIPGDRSKPLPTKPFPARSHQFEGTVSKGPPPVELPAVQSQERWNSRGRTFAPSPGPASEMDVNEFLATEGRIEQSTSEQKLGSPMQSPIKSTWRNFSRLPGSSRSGTAVQSRSSGYKKGPQTTFFAPQEDENLEQSTMGSLRRNRRPSEQNQAASSPLSPVDEQNAETGLFAPDTALSPDADGTPGSETETRTVEADRSNRSVWHGGEHLSIVPGDSASEVHALRAQQAELKGLKKKVPLAGGFLDELGEREDVGDARAKETSENRFREEIRKVWSSYQTRMRMINEDVEKTEEEKRLAAKDEQRYLELLIGQASTDTGFEQLHEPGQKDEFVNNLLSIRSNPSRTPSILRKANKIMKWVLAVPDDPELKTHSSRKHRLQGSKLDAVPSNLQRTVTNVSELRAGPSRHQPTPLAAAKQMDRERQEDTPLSPDGRRRFHFAPTAPVHAGALHQTSFETRGASSQATIEQVKAGKMSYGPSVASSETGWPTQSQLAG